MKKQLVFNLLLLFVAVAAYVNLPVIENEKVSKGIHNVVSSELNKGMVIVVSKANTSDPEPLITLSDHERLLMAKIGKAEAEGEDIEGITDVMNVVWNRVQDDNFPNSIEGVIYDPLQFAVISNGRFDSVVPDEIYYRAVEMFTRGYNKSQGALYFESESDSTWHKDNLEFLFQHGNHYFYTNKEE